MTKIIAFSGRKQSGKSSGGNFVLGCVLTNLGLTPDFKLSDNGELLIPYWAENGDKFYAPYDFSAHTDINKTEVWPHIKLYNFADKLKQVAIEIFQIPKELVYGSDIDKDQMTDFYWSDMPTKQGTRLLRKRDQMSVREFLQHLGTGIFRQIWEPVWVQSCMRQIKEDNSEWAIIGDCRFPNEVEGIQNNGGTVIRLTRNSDSTDTHKSEIALDKENFDHARFNSIIDNINITLQEKNQAIFEYLVQIGWMAGNLYSGTP